MPDPTSPDTLTQPPAAPPAPAPAPAPADLVPFEHVWAATDGTLQSGLAGLITDRPELREAELTREEWQEALTQYLESPRP